MASESKDQARMAAGLKASIHNPNVSEEAKQRAAERLESMGTGETLGQHTVSPPSSEHEQSRVLGGYKATLASERASETAKSHAREVLEASGYTVERAHGVSEDEHEKRVIAGYKAALHNPRVSEGAKQHAQEFLKQHGVM
ncbi:unnamed protein product [Somion occarium]|uniref:Conidiation-specific protein 6 n=1 Tax=Somion occarium TaxID=3059160 RepID=A0ABP1DMM9_9APHY